MTRLNLVLLLAVLASALYLVRMQYESRRLFAEIERPQAEARRLEVEHERLQVEKRAQATPLRVEKLAQGAAADAHRHAGHHAVRHAARRPRRGASRRRAP